MKMQETEIHEYARKLLAAHGNGAIAEAAQKAIAFEKQNNKEEAENWRHIEKTLKLMSGPPES